MTGFQVWVAERSAALKRAICWFVGHRVLTGPWRRSLNTAHTHYREHECARCGASNTEQGWFNALDRGKGGPADSVPW